MAILTECPNCRKKQSNKNKLCKCGEDLDRAKRSGRVKFWINYRLPGGETEAKTFRQLNRNGQSRARQDQKHEKENRILDIRPDSKMNFLELTKWYLDLESVKALRSHWLSILSLKKFNSVFGEQIVSQIKLSDLENYQQKRKKEGKASSTIDCEVGKAKTVIAKAFDNDLVGGDTLKTFRRVKKLLKKGSDARNRILSLDEYRKLFDNSARHIKPIVAVAFHTGMRKGEILNLTWDKVDLAAKRLIQLEAEDTKDKEARDIPVCDELYEILREIPRALHDDHVFLFRGKPVTDIRDSLRRACKKAGITYGRFVKGGFIFHDLRHTFNTNMRKAGVSESVIMQITGHSTREMFDRYNTIDQNDTRKAVDQLGNYFASVDNPLTQQQSQAV